MLNICQAAISVIDTYRNELKTLLPDLERAYSHMITETHVLQDVWATDCSNGRVATSHGMRLWLDLAHERQAVEASHAEEIFRLDQVIHRLKRCAKRFERIARSVKVGKYFKLEKASHKHSRR